MTKIDLNTPRPHLRTLAGESLLLNIGKLPYDWKESRKKSIQFHNMNLWTLILKEVQIFLSYVSSVKP